MPGEVSKYRDSIFLERAIVGERLRLSMGLPLRPIDEHAPLSTGIEEAAGRRNTTSRPSSISSNSPATPARKNLFT